MTTLAELVAGTWNPSLHERDERGRFAETGSGVDKRGQGTPLHGLPEKPEYVRNIPGQVIQHMERIGHALPISAKERTQGVRAKFLVLSDAAAKYATSLHQQGWNHVDNDTLSRDTAQIHFEDQPPEPGAAGFKKDLAHARMAIPPNTIVTIRQRPQWPSGSDRSIRVPADDDRKTHMFRNLENVTTLKSMADLIMAGTWDESKHPRDDRGEFSDGGREDDQGMKPSERQDAIDQQRDEAAGRAYRQRGEAALARAEDDDAEKGTRAQAYKDRFPEQFAYTGPLPALTRSSQQRQARGGDTFVDEDGKSHKIATAGKGYAYIDTGGPQRDVVPMEDLVQTGPKQFVHKDYPNWRKDFKGEAMADDHIPTLAELQAALAVLQAAGNWDESKHPRATDGKFGSGGGGTSAKTSKDDVHFEKEGSFGPNDAAAKSARKDTSWFTPDIESKTRATYIQDTGMYGGEQKAADHWDNTMSKSQRVQEAVFQDRHTGYDPDAEMEKIKSEPGDGRQEKRQRVKETDRYERARDAGAEHPEAMKKATEPEGAEDWRDQLPHSTKQSQQPTPGANYGKMGPNPIPPDEMERATRAIQGYKRGSDAQRATAMIDYKNQRATGTDHLGALSIAFGRMATAPVPKKPFNPDVSPPNPEEAKARRARIAQRSKETFGGMLPKKPRNFKGAAEDSMWTRRDGRVLVRGRVTRPNHKFELAAVSLQRMFAAKKAPGGGGGKFDESKHPRDKQGEFATGVGTPGGMKFDPKPGRNEPGGSGISQHSVAGWQPVEGLENVYQATLGLQDPPGLDEEGNIQSPILPPKRGPEPATELVHIAMVQKVGDQWQATLYKPNKDGGIDHSTREDGPMHGSPEEAARWAEKRTTGELGPHQPEKPDAAEQVSNKPIGQNDAAKQDFYVAALLQEPRAADPTIRQQQNDARAGNIDRVLEKHKNGAVQLDPGVVKQLETARAAIKTSPPVVTAPPPAAAPGVDVHKQHEAFVKANPNWYEKALGRPLPPPPAPKPDPTEARKARRAARRAARLGQSAPEAPSEPSEPAAAPAKAPKAAPAAPAKGGKKAAVDKEREARLERRRARREARRKAGKKKGLKGSAMPTLADLIAAADLEELAAAGWDESKHPRDKKGEFSESGSGGGAPVRGRAGLKQAYQDITTQRAADREEHQALKLAWFTPKIEREAQRDFIGDEAEYTSVEKAKAKWDKMTRKQRAQAADDIGLKPDEERAKDDWSRKDHLKYAAGKQHLETALGELSGPQFRKVKERADLEDADTRKGKPVTMTRKEVASQLAMDEMDLDLGKDVPTSVAQARTYLADLLKDSPGRK